MECIDLNLGISKVIKNQMILSTSHAFINHDTNQVDIEKTTKMNKFLLTYQQLEKISINLLNLDDPKSFLLEHHESCYSNKMFKNWKDLAKAVEETKSICPN